MNILFVSIAWPRPGERNLYSDLMNEFVNNGHEVFVLCADENEPNTCLNKENKINVLRVNTMRVRKVNKFKKALALFSLGRNLEKEALKYWSNLRVDIIISHSPPITLSGLLKSLKTRFTAPLYYLLKDIWPHGPVDLKMIGRHGIIYYYFRLHEKRIYRLADFIGCMSPMNVDYILRKNDFLTKGKVEVCPNTITPRSITLKEKRSTIRGKYKIPEDATVFIFSGNIGKAHGLSFYIDAIEGLKDFNNAYFLVGGSGLYYNYVVQEIAKRSLTNIGTYPRLPIDDFDQLLLSSDVGVVLLDSKYTVPQFPSRLLAYLEASKPVLCSVNKDTDIGNIVEEAECGISTIHGDLESFIKAVKYFCDKNNSGSIEKMKVNANSLLHQKYTSECSYNIITKHFQG